MKADSAPDPDLESGPALCVEPGWGFSAWTENGCLQISQTREGDDAELVALSKTEFKVLAAQFAEWAA